MDGVSAPILSQVESAFYLLALSAFIATRLWHLTALPLSYDEIFSLHTVKQDWGGLFAFVRKDMVHPPLFYILLKPWVGIGGESVFWLRLFPALTAIVTIFPLLKLYRELNLRTAEVSTALVLISANAYLIYYSQLLRMYSLFFFLSVCSLWFFVRFSKASADKWPLWALFGVNLLLVYTHYFGWVLVAVELLILLFRRNPRLLSFTVTTVLIAICFSPWVYAVSQAYLERGLHPNLGWINRPHFSDVILFFNTLNDRPFDFPLNEKLGMILFGAPILLGGWQMVKTERGDDKAKDNTFSLLLLFSILPIVLVYSVSLLVQQSIWLPRGLVFIAVPYFTLVSVAILRLRWHWIRTVALALVLVWAILAGFKNTTQRAEQINFKEWVHRMAQAETSQSRDIKVYTLDDHTPFIIWFYLNSESDSRFQVSQVKGLTPQGMDYWLNDSMFQTVNVKDLTALEGNHFWLAFNKTEWEEERMPQEIFRDAGYRVGEEFKGGRKNKEIYLFQVWR